MLLLKLFRFLFGYVSLTASGGFPERFVNLCAAGRVNLWDLKSRGNVLTACADRASYKRIRPAAKKSGMRVRVTRKHGLPFFLRSHRRRVGVLVGVLLFACATAALSNRVWSINVAGNDRVPAETIIAVCEQLGVRNGVRSKSIDVSDVEFKALQKLGSIYWLNINVSGSAVLIEVREGVETPVADSVEVPADIVAARDGQLVTLRTFDGTAAQKIGSGVLKGDLLISGVEESRHGTVSFCRAKGYAVARTRRELTAQVVFENALSRRRRVRRRYSVGILSFNIPLGSAAPPEGTVRCSEMSAVKIGKTVLPLSLTEHTFYGKPFPAARLSEKRARLLAENRFFEQYAAQFRYLLVEEQKITVAPAKNGVTVSGEFTCLENIGKTQDMDIDDSGAAQNTAG